MAAFGAVGAGAAGRAGAGAVGVNAAAGGWAMTVFAGSMSVEAIGISTMLLLKFTRTFCPSIAISRTFVPVVSVTLPNCNCTVTGWVNVAELRTAGAGVAVIAGASAGAGVGGFAPGGGGGGAGEKFAAAFAATGGGVAMAGSPAG
jgi:hypothetical protein